MIQIKKFQTESGVTPFDHWMNRIDVRAQVRVAQRLNRIERGNFGNHKGVGRGVMELRIDYGPGYRVYFGRDGSKIVILLGGGTKKRQHADIENAQKYWRKYQQENRHADRTVQDQ